MIIIIENEEITNRYNLSNIKELFDFVKKLKIDKEDLFIQENIENLKTFINLCFIKSTQTKESIKDILLKNKSKIYRFIELSKYIKN